MSKQEMQETFRTMDLNDSGIVDSKEYSTFYNIFIKDFLKCTDGEWKIQAAKAKECIPEQRWFKSLRLNVEHRENLSYSPHENEEDTVDFLTDIVHVADRNLDG